MPNEPQKVIVQSNRIDAKILPPGFSLAYKLYVIQQTTDLKNIADASNNATDLAYQATIKNQEQDSELADHETRISGLRSEVDNHEGRITESEKGISALGSRVDNTETSISGLQDRVGATESGISAIQSDYVSKSATAMQGMGSPLGVTTSLSVNGVKVVGIRQTGFTAAAGTALKGSFNADATYTVGTTYTQAQVQAIANDLRATRQRLKALEDAMRAHGLIN